MKDKIYIFKCIISLVIILILPGVLAAQIHTSGAPTFGSGDVNDAPIDGGLSLLVAAGVGYGVKRIKDKRLKSTQKNS